MRVHQWGQDLSGGELQRFACALACVADAEIYLFDEPSSYLDVKQRIHAARIIRSLAAESKCVVFEYVDVVSRHCLSHVILCMHNHVSRAYSYIIAVEHDLSVLDYLSDFVCCLYGYVEP